MKIKNCCYVYFFGLTKICVYTEFTASSSNVVGDCRKTWVSLYQDWYATKSCWILRPPNQDLELVFEMSQRARESTCLICHLSFVKSIRFSSNEKLVNMFVHTVHWLSSQILILIAWMSFILLSPFSRCFAGDNWFIASFLTSFCPLEFLMLLCFLLQVNTIKNNRD